MSDQENNQIELFHPDTMVDRGRMTNNQFWALFRYHIIKRYENNELYRENNFEHYLETKEKYDSAGYDFTDCMPLNLYGKWNVWFSVKTTDIYRVIESISPSFLVEQLRWVDWHQNPSDGFTKKTKSNYVMVLPPCAGTVFICLNYKFKRKLADKRAFEKNYQKMLKMLSKFIPDFWTNLKEQFQDVFLCWDDDTNLGTIVWRNNKLRRVIATQNLEPVETYGKPIHGEVLVGDEDVFGSDTQPHEVDQQRYWANELHETSFNLGISPRHIPPLFPDEKAYCWFVGV